MRVRTDDPVSSSVRYTGEIVRILERRCLHCHGNDGLAMPLTNYRDVRAWGRAIREEIVEQRMPPWSAARGYRRFRNELALTSREQTTILSWLDGGMPRGDDRNLPPPHAATGDAGSSPDLHLTIPSQTVPALEDHVVRRVVIDTNLDGERAVERLVVNPDHRSLLRAALVFAGDPDGCGRWVGAWLPWQQRVTWPDASAIRLPARTHLTVELNYRGGEKEISDQPSIDLFYADVKVRLKPDTTATVRLKADTTDARPYEGVRDAIVTSASPWRVASATTVWAILPTSGASANSLELTARRPNGSTEVLLWIPDFRREWPQVLILEEPVTLPTGTTVSLIMHPPAATARARLVGMKPK